VTVAEWNACVSIGGCPDVTDPGFGGQGTRPVVNVSWVQAKKYVEWFSKMTGKPYRLLTEAEWEYAARAGSSSTYFWGDEAGEGNAECHGCNKVWDQRTSPVGSYKPNAFGLYDMAGNVWQWVEDCHHENYNGAPVDGSAWISKGCGDRVDRGGSWYEDALKLRSAYRDQYPAEKLSDNVGLRVARTLAP
jgi:formylglycine-generating enzyme required for sulfatase activity